MPLGRGVLYAPNQDLSRRVGDFFDRRRATLRPIHTLKNLKYAPSLVSITLGVQDSFTLEVHIIGECVTALRRIRDTLELALYVRTLGRHRLHQHLRKRVLQPRNQKFRLNINGVSKKLAQLIHLRRVLGVQKLGTRIPWTGSLVDS